MKSVKYQVDDIVFMEAKNIMDNVISSRVDIFHNYHMCLSSLYIMHLRSFCFLIRDEQVIE